MPITANGKSELINRKAFNEIPIESSVTEKDKH
jgi:hypothetical protein